MDNVEEWAARPQVQVVLLRLEVMLSPTLESAMAIVRRRKRVQVAKGVYQNFSGNGSLSSISWKQGNRTITTGKKGTSHTFNMGDGISAVYRGSNNSRRSRSDGDSGLLAFLFSAIINLVIDAFGNWRERRALMNAEPDPQIEAPAAVPEQTPKSLPLMSAGLADGVMSLICEAGVSAVKKARSFTGVQHDNAIREETISAHMAEHLSQQCEMPVETEVAYTTILKTFGVEIDDVVLTAVGGRKADFVIWCHDRANVLAVVEVKKFDEGQSVQGVLSDLDKAMAIHLDTATRVFSAVMVCETKSKRLEEREKMLTDSPDRIFKVSAPEKASNGEWRWSFICMRRQR